MARIQGVPRSQAGPIVRLVYGLGPRMTKKLAGREPRSGSGLEPVEIWAHQPKMMSGMGRFNQAVRKGKAVEERLKNLALDYAVGVMRTPVDVTDKLFAQVKKRFSDEQLVEITALLTLVNLDRFNAAFGIGWAGFSEGLVCVPPDRPVADPVIARIA